MKEIILSRGKVAWVDDDDFEYLNQWKWMAHGTYPHIYARRATSKAGGVKSIFLSMHREILGVSDKDVLVDHADHNGLNNQRYNIRVCTESQNNSNKKSARNSTSQYLGVSWCRHKNRWLAVIQTNGKQRHLGYFKSESEAAIAYNKAAFEKSGKFANLNQV